jgi:hypothetical protein
VWQQKEKEEEKEEGKAQLARLFSKEDDTNFDAFFFSWGG